MFPDHAWQLQEAPEVGDLIRVFDGPAFEGTWCYDPLTGYFNAGTLALVARGIEGRVRDDGHMHLVVGCALGASAIGAIACGEAARDQVERHPRDVPLRPPGDASVDALERLDPPPPIPPLR